MKPAIIGTNKIQFRGAVRELFRLRDHEIIISGPYETGKTFGSLSWLNAFMAKYSNAYCVMARSTYKSLKTSAVVTFEMKIHGGKIGNGRYPVKKYGGNSPELYLYPNGSKLILVGMDNPDKLLSGEFDAVYIPQCEELTLDEWQVCVGRTTGRAGNTPYTRVLGDCNPDAPSHWIRHRESVKFLETRHEDNPRLFNNDGTKTELGKKTIAILDNLTGLRYKRGRLGLWAGAEGQIYEYNPEIHLLRNFTIPKHWRRIRSIDFGYRNAFVCQWWALDEDDRMYLYREIYMTGILVEDHARQINLFSRGEVIHATVADHDAEDAATLARYGIDTIPAYKAVKRGIENVQSRLRVQGDGRPRLFVIDGTLIEFDDVLKKSFKPTSTKDEFAAYVWSKKGKEVPEKEHDHAMDAMRYACAFVDGLATDDGLLDGRDEIELMGEYQSISGW